MVDVPAYRFTAKLPQYNAVPRMVDTSFTIEDGGLSVRQGRSERLIAWASIRFIHLSVTSGVGTTGFPVYSARVRTFFRSCEITSLDWQGEKGVDRSTDYVRFVEALIPFAAAPNRHVRLRHGGDPMLEGAIPMVLVIFITPLILMLFVVVKVPAAVLGVAWTKPLAKLATWLFGLGFGAVMNALPWSSGKRFEPHDLPIAELPKRLRDGG